MTPTDRAPADERAPKTRGRTIRWARFYDAVTAVLMLGKQRSIREMTVELAAVAPGENVLDVGCGTGSLTLAAKARAGPAGEVHGVDAAPEMIDVARRKVAKAGVDVAFEVGLAEDLPYPEDHFDVVLSSLVLHHLPDDLKRKGFAEIRRVLKPGGRFLAVDFKPSTSALPGPLKTLLSHHGAGHGNVGELPAMMEEAGFTAVETGPTKHGVLSFIRGTAREAPDGR